MSEAHYVQIVTALRGGLFKADEAIRFSSRRSAADAADQLQEEFDADADPKRAYVLDSDRVPVYAGGQIQ